MNEKLYKYLNGVSSKSLFLLKIGLNKEKSIYYTFQASQLSTKKYKNYYFVSKSWIEWNFSIKQKFKWKSQKNKWKVE